MHMSVKDKLVVSQSTQEATVYSLVLYRLVGCGSVPHGPVLADHEPIIALVLAWRVELL